jgi:hypothetical protein
VAKPLLLVVAHLDANTPRVKKELSAANPKILKE